MRRVGLSRLSKLAGISIVLASQVCIPRIIKRAFKASLKKLLRLNKGPLAQRLEQGTHNPLVDGSNPSRPILLKYDSKINPRESLFFKNMDIVCLDLEGVLIPEIWQAVAKATGVEALMRTTRDEPDYDVLMRYRLRALNEHDLRIDIIQKTIQMLDPLPGAEAFLKNLRSQVPVIILSDTFAEFARPLMVRLGYPTLLCHDLEIDADGRIRDYRLRQSDAKRDAVVAFRSLNFRIIAAGDSYNDLSMLQTADHGILFCPPDTLVSQQPNFPVTRDHATLLSAIEKCFQRPNQGSDESSLGR